MMAPTLHARLGASSSHRWMNCPGSIRQSAGHEDVGSPYAWEGTAAHLIAERCLTAGTEPQQYVGEFVGVWVAEDQVEAIEVTEEMAEAVDEFVTYVRRKVKEAGPWAIVSYERTFDLAVLKPPLPMFGTADVVIWNPVTKHLIVIDYKHGQGVVVEVFENSQPMYYALGATVANGTIPKTVEITIVQPRAYHDEGSIRTYTFDRERLVAFKKELFTAAEATQAPDAPLKVGEWCKFCPAKVHCPAQREHAVELLQSDFTYEDPTAPPRPDQLTPEQVAVIVSRSGFVMDWLREVEAHALVTLQQGGAVPGFKLVEGRTHRRWTEPAKADAFLARQGLKKTERTTTKVISPAQAEKLLKARGAPAASLEKYWEKPDGKPKMAPLSDPRPAIAATIDEDFPADSLLEALTQSIHKDKT